VTWIVTIAGFAALIILHEFGHFVMAKATGMRVERFFLFFPPKLVSFRRGETEYGIGMIPLGGFVKITGMNPEELEAAERGEEREGERRPGLLEQIEGADSGRDTPDSIEGPGPVDPEILKRAYYNQPVWKRVVVIAAGPAVNILIALVLLFAVFVSVPVPRGLAVDQVQSGTPAAKALHVGDRMVSVDGVPATVPNLSKIDDANTRLNAADRKFAHITKTIRQHHCPGGKTPGCLSAKPVTLVVDRNGHLVTLHIPTYYDASNKIYRLGIRFKTVGTQVAHQSPAEAGQLAVDKTWFVTSRTLSLIGRIFEPQERKQLSGIVGGSQALNQAISFDIHQALFVLAVISLSLGLINLFPFLPLDGGHIFWSLVEKVRGRRVPFAVIERASAVGFLLVLLLFVVGLTNDINRLSS
jgi:regulator of sigma E protease